MRESCSYRSVRPEKQVYARVVSVLCPSYSTQSNSVCLLEFLERIRIRSYSRLSRHGSGSIERAQRGKVGEKVMRTRVGTFQIVNTVDLFSGEAHNNRPQSGEIPSASPSLSALA